MLLLRFVTLTWCVGVGLIHELDSNATQVLQTFIVLQHIHYKVCVQTELHTPPRHARWRLWLVCVVVKGVHGAG